MCSYFQRDLRWGQLKASSTCRGQQLKPFVTRSLKCRACEKPFKSNRIRRSCCNLQAAPFETVTDLNHRFLYSLFLFLNVNTEDWPVRVSSFFLAKRKRTRFNLHRASAPKPTKEARASLSQIILFRYDLPANLCSNYFGRKAPLMLLINANENCWFFDSYSCYLEANQLTNSRKQLPNQHPDAIPHAATTFHFT